MIVEQYGVTVTDVLPDDIGVFWALPTSDSTPANPKWDVEKFFHPSSKSFAVHQFFQAEGSVTFTSGSPPSFSTEGTKSTVSYTISNDGVVALSSPSEDTFDHWRLNTS